MPSALAEHEREHEPDDEQHGPAGGDDFLVDRHAAVPYGAGLREVEGLRSSADESEPIARYSACAAARRLLMFRPQFVKCSLMSVILLAGVFS